jgi:hypothetical protein
MRFRPDRIEVLKSADAGEIDRDGSEHIRWLFRLPASTMQQARGEAVAADRAYREPPIRNRRCHPSTFHGTLPLRLAAEPPRVLGRKGSCASQRRPESSGSVLQGQGIAKDRQRESVRRLEVVAPLAEAGGIFHAVRPTDLREPCKRMTTVNRRIAGRPSIDPASTTHGRTDGESGEGWSLARAVMSRNRGLSSSSEEAVARTRRSTS